MKNGLNSKRKLLLLMSWTFVFSWATAQPNLAFYSLTDQFNSFDYNPAFLTSPEKFTFSMFPLAGTSLGYNNQRMINKLASKFLEGSITNSDYQEAFTSMVSHSTFHQNMEGVLLSFTFRSDIGFFNFRIKDRQYFLATVGGETSKFIFSPDIQTALINEAQHLPGQAAHYREYSLGYSHQSRDKRFNAGIRAKLYYGKFAVFSDISGTIQPDENDYVLKTSGLIHISFPDEAIETPDNSTNTIELNSSKIMDYIFNSGNPGMGLDLGIHYRLSPALSLSMSVMDLGKINWKNNLNSRRLDQEYLLPYSTYQVINNNGVQTITKRENYSYSDSFDFDKLDYERSPFSKPLPTVLYAGIKYQLSPDFSLSLTDRYVVVKHLNYNSFSVTANFELNKKLSISTGYSAIADSYLNIPFALLYQGDFGQFYIGTDNMTALGLPSSSGFIGFSAGAAFYLFRKRNLYKHPSDDLPFFRPRKVIKKPKSGFILNSK